MTDTVWVVRPNESSLYVYEDIEDVFTDYPSREDGPQWEHWEPGPGLDRWTRGTVTAYRKTVKKSQVKPLDSTPGV